MNRWKYNPQKWVTFFFIVNCWLSIVNLTACYDDRLEPGTEQSGSDIEIAMTIDLPGDVQYQSGTKAMTADEEQKVDHIHILAFVYDGTDYIYDYTAKGTALNPSGNQLTFKARLKTYPMQQRFMIIANAGTEIEAAALNGKTPAGVQQLLITQQNTEWPARNTVSGPVRSIPMYTLTPATTVTTTTTTLGSYGILRMLARIDIKKNAAVTNFRLTSASLFNRKDRGYIGFNESDWDNSAKKVTAPAIPAGTTTIKLPTAAYAADSESFLRSIYTFEAEGTTDRKTATAIVIGGYYDYPANNTKETYYRIDIPAFDAGGNPLANTMGDILRNHLYEIEIKGISSEGAPTPLDAFEGEVTLKADITPWNLAKNNILFDGQYSFKIDRSRVKLDKDESIVFVSIETDYSGGIRINPVSDIWLSTSGFTNGSQSGILTIKTEKNETGLARSATLTLTVNNLTYHVSISQDDKAWIEWENHQIYYPNGKFYSSYSTNGVSIKSNNEWSATVTDLQGIIQTENISTGGIGDRICELRMSNKADNALFHEAFVTFKDMTGTYDDKIYPIINMEGTTNNVSNCILTQTNRIITIPSAFRKAQAIWTYGDGVSGALGELKPENLSAHVVWQDGANIIMNKDVTVIGSGIDSQLQINVGSNYGNAIVALTSGSTIIWSWHIWIPRGTPYVTSNGWLNLSLGATNNTIAQNTAIGFNYQWGRKDPFPKTRNITNSYTTQIEYYDGEGLPMSNSSKELVFELNTGPNLLNSIKNPFTLYTNGDYGWYDLNTNVNPNLWSTVCNDKTIFDPCPAGYKVPQSNNVPSAWLGRFTYAASDWGLSFVSYNMYFANGPYYQHIGGGSTTATLNGGGNQSATFALSDQLIITGTRPTAQSYSVTVRVLSAPPYNERDASRSSVLTGNTAQIKCIRQ